MASSEIARTSDEIMLPGFTGQVIEGEVIDPDSFAGAEWVGRCDNSGPNCPEFALLRTGHVAIRSTLAPEHVAVFEPGELAALHAGTGVILGQMAIGGNAPAQIEA